MNEIFELPTEQLDAFISGYLTCMLWSSTDDEGEPLDATYDERDLAAPSLAGSKAECRDFMIAQRHDLIRYVKNKSQVGDTGGWSSAGHDFWLNRNGHGAGFWDRGMGALGDRLSNASRDCGGRDVYVGDDGMIHLMGLEKYQAA